METDEQDVKELETSLSTLKLAAGEADDAVTAALNRLKLVQFKVKQEIEELSETELRSKASLRQWLKARDLSTECSFQEFFQVFLNEHEKEYRLDLSDRSILLNKDACKLFGLTGKNTKLSMPEVLQKLPLIYH
jgi:hypothetical protein